MEFFPEGDRDQLYEDSNLGCGIRQSMELDVEETCFFLISGFWAKRKLGHTDTDWEQEAPSNLHSKGARAAREEREASSSGSLLHLSSSPKKQVLSLWIE